MDENKKSAMEEFIQSRQNPRVKSLMKLRDRAERKKLGVFAVEGLRELSRCVKLSDVEEIYYCPEFFKSPEHELFVKKIADGKKIPLCRLSEGAFEKVSNREGCDGLIGVAKQWGCCLSDILLPEGRPTTILIADAIEKPGNLGAIIRTADSERADALILTNCVCDIFNPAAVRASQGALFSLQIATAGVDETADWLKANKIKSVGAHLGADKKIWEADFTKSTAIVMGCESDGLGEDWERRLDEKVLIPMSGISDSLNVNVAAAIFLYESLRQNGAK